MSFSKSRNKTTPIATFLRKTFGIINTQPLLFEVDIEKNNATWNVSEWLGILTKKFSLAKSLRDFAVTMLLGRMVFTHAIS